MLIPDTANLIPEDLTLVVSGQEMPVTWLVWIALIHLSLAGACLLSVYASKTYALKCSLLGCAIWCCLQALDAMLAGNFFVNGYIEYPLLAAYSILLALHIRTHERDERKQAG